jgi:hypothetical protein
LSKKGVKWRRKLGKANRDCQSTYLAMNGVTIHGAVCCSNKVGLKVRLHSGFNTFLTAMNLPRASGFLGIKPLSTNKERHT